MHGNRRFTDEDERRIAAAYHDGLTLKQVARQWGCGTTAVAGALRRLGTARRVGGPSKRLSPQAHAALAAEYRRVGSAPAIARAWGLPRGTVEKALRRQGVVKQRSPGHIDSSGYRRVYVGPDDPLVGMAPRKGPGRRGGYVGEHRLVMARALGRALTRKETVHHKNGVRDDNRLENLELRAGHHGAGQVACCAECGSRNIVHLSLGG